MAIRDRTQVNGGSVGAAATTGDSINTTTDTKLGVGNAVIGPRIVLGDRTVAGNLFTNQPVAPHATYASLSPFSPAPAAPAIAAFSAGSTAIVVNSGQSATQAAGSFGQVTVNGTLNLSGGTYLFQNLTLGPGGALVATAPSIVRIAGRISGADRARIAATTNAGALRIFVAGANNTNGGVVLGTDAQLTALVVSKAAFQAGDRLVASGALAASDISLGLDSTFNFNTGFACSSDAACDDGNPCTTDSCVDTQCRHANAADGSSCSDSNACTGSDHCQAGTCVSGAPVACDDGLFCNGTETCSSGSGCVAGTPPPVSDGIACTIDSCDEATKLIDHFPNDALCGSGFRCDVTKGCVDIDECSSGTANCDANAKCTNTSGGFTCTCNDGFTGDGTVCTQTCTPITVGFGVQRCVLARPDGTVDLFLSPSDSPASPFEQKYCQPGTNEPPCLELEPDVNFCGPTAAKNMLVWWGSDEDYGPLGDDMKTNTWDTVKLTEVCSLTCNPLNPFCDAGCAVIAGEAIGAVVKAGSLPSDVNATMDSIAPPGYVRCNDESDITEPQLQWSLAHGDPVMFLESRGSGNLHWAVVMGTYKDPATGELMLRIANDDDVSFTQWRADRSLDELGSLEETAVKTVSVNPTIVRYAKATDALPGNICDDWHSNVLTQAAGGPPIPPTAAGNALVGYQTTFNGQNQQHVVFVGSDAHVHELFYTDHWQESDLVGQATTATDMPPPVASGSPLAAYTTSFNNQEHVDYLSADGHINELMFDTAWHWKDLTLDSGAPAAVVTGALTGYATNYNQQHHVSFIDATSGQLWELFINAGDTHWQKSDLSTTAKKDDGTAPPAPKAGTPLGGYATNFNNQEHVDYIDAANGEVWELFFDGSNWHAVDVTMKAGAPKPDPASTLTAYTTDFNNQQHIDFVGSDGHVHELFFGSEWLSVDLNVAAGIPSTPARTSALRGYATETDQQEHVAFVSTTDSHVYELFFVNQTVGWQARDLTLLPAPPAPVPSATSLLTAYESTFNKQEHIDYIGTNGHVYELFL